MSDYMDYPFYCEEKLGDRCGKQCSVCKEGDEKRLALWKAQREFKSGQQPEKKKRRHRASSAEPKS